MSKGKHVWIVTEGETDEEFYKKVVGQLRQNFDGQQFKVDKLDYYCAKGIGNFAKKIPNTYKNKIVSKYPEQDKIVFLCYDTDVFDFSLKPPINKNKLAKDLKALGAKKIYHIKADKTIEDFFLVDSTGIINFLRLGKKYKVNKSHKGLDLLKKMYKDANKTYFKGEKTEGLIDALNLNLIMGSICKQLSNLCKELGYDCDKGLCLKKSKK
ncbi:MAG: hypothetical protein PHY08_08075 [Candidatus Cloacimonetes bacterium]|nr:hypothetical protein [Candidatus Cloacimonadota bacterium]